MNKLERFKDIKTFIFDVDGVFTDTQMLITESGEFLRRMSTRDGYAMKKALNEGYRVAIITGGNSKGVEMRFKYLGIEDYYANTDTKLVGYYEMMNKYDLNADQILYMGDDMLDIPVLRKVGLATCPEDADREVKKIVDYISPYKGGHGCVRDVIEKVLRLNDKWL